MAASKHDVSTEHWALNHAAAMERAFQGAWWLPNIPQYADSLTDPSNQPLMQRWWTGVTPMEAELYPGGAPQPGLAPRADALSALALREISCYSGQYGLYVEGAPGCDSGSYQSSKSQQAYTLNTAVNQAWGTYGVLWPVVHQQLGVDPQLGNGLLEVLPAVPTGQTTVAGNNIRIGTGTINVVATHNGNVWTTVVTSRLSSNLHIGATLPAGSTIHRVLLNGKHVAYKVRDTNAGRQVFVSTSCGSTAQVTVVAN
jgi:hypothetical protein